MNIENHRRVMSMPLRNVVTDDGGARVERGWMTELPSCRADACQQGDKPCPCPDACVLPVTMEDKPSMLASRGFWGGLCVSLVIWSGIWYWLTQ